MGVPAAERRERGEVCQVTSRFVLIIIVVVLIIVVVDVIDWGKITTERCVRLPPGLFSVSLSLFSLLWSLLLLSGEQ